MSRDQYPNGSGSSKKSFFANLSPEQDYPKNKGFRVKNIQNINPEPALDNDEDYELEEEEEYEESKTSMNQQQISQESDIIDISDSDDEDEQQVNGSYHNNNNNNNNNNYEVRSQNIYQNVIDESDESNDCEIVSEYKDTNAQRIRDPRMTTLDIEIEEASRISTNGTVNYLLLNNGHNF